MQRRAARMRDSCRFGKVRDVETTSPALETNALPGIGRTVKKRLPWFSFVLQSNA
jgi:hypothetical protein